MTTDLDEDPVARRRIALVSEGHCPFDLTRLIPGLNYANEACGYCTACARGFAASSSAYRGQPGYTEHFPGFARPAL